jgi:hypothetical protein
MFKFWLDIVKANTPSETHRNEADELHRVDGPAVVWKNGDTEWYYEGKLHRLDGPAVKKKGYTAWYHHGDLEAKVHIDGTDITQSWYHEGRLHREDGPAIIDTHIPTGRTKETWYRDGSIHREKAPAVIVDSGNKLEWWEKGRVLQFETRNRSVCLRVIKKESWGRLE